MPFNDSLQSSDKEAARLSIGAVSKATGIPTETLRTWERRYGFPSPQRTDSGHRKYSEQTVERLMLVNRALEQGMRPGDVLPKGMDALHALLDITESAKTLAADLDHMASPGHHADVRLMSQVTTSTVDAWMQHLVQLDEESLQNNFEQNWFRLGPMTFLSQLIAPFLKEIGLAWYEGRIAVIHEQFASNQLRTFLSTQWRELSQRNTGPHVVCATLPGEFHAIGLHMIAVVMAITGCQVAFLGCDSPIETIAQVTENAQARAVLISVSGAANTTRSAEQLDQLRARLPKNIAIVAGGQGSPSHIDQVLHMSTLRDLEQWISQYTARYNTAH